MNIDAFIAFWANTEGGAERANTAPYIMGLLRALGLPPPDPAGATTLHNDYVFERAVRPKLPFGSSQTYRPLQARLLPDGGETVAPVRHIEAVAVRGFAQPGPRCRTAPAGTP